MQSNSKRATKYSLHNAGLKVFALGLSNDGVNYAAINDGMTDA